MKSNPIIPKPVKFWEIEESWVDENHITHRRTLPLTFCYRETAFQWLKDLENSKREGGSRYPLYLYLNSEKNPVYRAISRKIILF